MSMDLSTEKDIWPHALCTALLDDDSRELKANQLREAECGLLFFEVDGAVSESRRPMGESAPATLGTPPTCCEEPKQDSEFAGIPELARDCPI